MPENKERSPLDLQRKGMERVDLVQNGIQAMMWSLEYVGGFDKLIKAMEGWIKHLEMAQGEIEESWELYRSQEWKTTKEQFGSLFSAVLNGCVGQGEQGSNTDKVERNVEGKENG